MSPPRAHRLPWPLLAGALAGGLAASLLAGCSDEPDDDRLSRRAWIRRADAICRAENADRAVLEAPAFDPLSGDLTSAQLAEAADFLERSLTLSDDTTEQLDTLGLPATDADEVEEILDERASGRERLVRAIEGARDGDMELFRDNFGRASGDYAEAGRLAAELGLRQCGQEPAA